MSYDFTAFMADRATMRFSRTTLLTAKVLDNKRKRLAAEGEAHDQAAVDAACARLLTWVESGAPEPANPIPERPETPPNQPWGGVPDSAAEPPGPSPEEVARAAAAQEWAAELGRQAERHARRRGRFPKVKPAVPA